MAEDRIIHDRLMDFLRKLIEQKTMEGMTYAELGRIVKVPESTLWKWKNGEQRPAAARILAAIRALGGSLMLALEEEPDVVELIHKMEINKLPISGLSKLLDHPSIAERIKADIAFYLSQIEDPQKE